MLAHDSGLSAADRRFLQSFLPDAEDAPWMAVTDWHLIALIAALLPLRWFAAAARREWYIGSEIAVWYPLPEGGRNYVVPDIFVALAPNILRTSFDVEREGGFPPFVLEIVSEESRVRDTGPDEKVRLYGLLGVQEYAIFDPEGHVQPPLQGYRRTPQGAWGRWPIGARGELASGVLGLTLVADGQLLRLEDAAGHRLPTPDEERLRAESERQRAEREHLRAEREHLRAVREQRRAEREQRRAEQEEQRAEQAQLRAERERLRAEEEERRAERERLRAEEVTARLAEERARAARLEELLARHGIPFES